ncbi:MAG: hypothetical protein GY856_55445 [bacterium]|nr:hypothetical protein [bacterium]
MVATFPVTSAGSSDQSTFVVEALVDPTSSDWIGVGYASESTGPFPSGGELWMVLRSNGELHVHAGGLTHGLYAGFPSAFAAGPNRLRLEYGRTSNTVRAWLNDVELMLDVSDLDALGFAPNIRFAGFHGNKQGGFAIGGLSIDDFELTKSENTLADSGFEEATSSWTTSYPSSFPATSFRNGTWGTAAPHTGSSGYAISNQAYGALLSDHIPIQPSTEYDLSALVRGEIDTEDSFSGLLIRASYYDSSGASLGYSNVVTDSSFASASWQRRGGSFTTPANAAEAMISLYSYQSSGWLAFDDVELKPTGSSTNLAPDPGFEETPGAWTVWTYSPFPATSVWRSTWGPAYHDGGYSYVISNFGYGLLETEPISVLADTEYDLLAWVKGEVDPDGSFQGLLMRVTFYNSSNSKISHVDVHGDSAFHAASWEQRGGRFTTPAGTATVKVALYNYLSTGWIAFDDVELVRVGGGGGNLVSDSGFELDDGTWSERPYGSFPNGWFPGTAMWRANWALIRSGSRAFVMGNLAYGYLVSESVDVVPETEYALSLWARGEIDAEDTVYGARCRVRLFDAANSLLQTVDLETWVPQTTTWEEHSYQFLTPPGAVRLKIDLFNLLGSGWVAYDDLELVRTSPDPEAPPYLAQQPADVLTTLGANASLQAVVAGGTGALHLQWQHRPFGGDWSDVSGATSVVLTIPSVAAQSLGDYRLRVSDSAPTPRTVHSSPARLRLPLTIDPVLSPRYPEIGSTLEMECAASGGVEPYSYRWQFKSDGGSYTDLQVTERITGAFWHRLTITGIEAGDAGTYRCRVNDADPSQEAVVSTAAQVIVMPEIPGQCAPLEPAPGDFSTEVGMGEWSETLNAWTYDATEGAAYLETRNFSIAYRPDVYGLLARDGVVIPKHFDKLRVTFAKLHEYQGFSLRLRWSDDENEFVAFVVNEAGDPPSS